MESKKVCMLSTGNYNKNGLDIVEKNIVQVLRNSNKIDLEIKETHKVEKNFPLSTTVEKFIRIKKDGKKINEDADTILVPKHDLLNFDPEKVDSKVVLHVHDIFPSTHFFRDEIDVNFFNRFIGYPIKNIFLDIWMERLCKVDKIIASSEYVKQQILKHTTFDGDIKVVYQGVDNLPMCQPRKRDIDLLYVGDTSGRKNHKFLRKTLAKAVRQDYKVVTVNHKKESLPGSTYTDISSEKLVDLYCRSKFYFQPSFTEGFGRCPVEAQRYGCTPLALDNQINNEILGESFYKVEKPKDVIKYLKNDYNEVNLFSKCVENSGKYTWRKFENKLVKEL